jgi:hypothetical protein
VFGQSFAINVAVLYLIGWGEDNRLHQDIANALIILLGAIVQGYIFGAVWDDRNKDAAIKNGNPNDPPVG